MMQNMTVTYLPASMDAYFSSKMRTPEVPALPAIFDSICQSFLRGDIYHKQTLYYGLRRMSAGFDSQKLSSDRK